MCVSILRNLREKPMNKARSGFSWESPCLAVIIGTVIVGPRDLGGGCACSRSKLGGGVSEAGDSWGVFSTPPPQLPSSSVLPPSAATGLVSSGPPLCSELAGHPV